MSLQRQRGAPITVLLVGADGAGKTTLLNILKRGLLWDNPESWSSVPKSRASFGFNVEYVTARIPNASAITRSGFGNATETAWQHWWRRVRYGSRYRMPTTSVRLCLFDVGGNKRIRSIWTNYYAEAHAVIFLVDAAGSAERLAEARRLLEHTAFHECVAGKPLLVLLNDKSRLGLRWLREKIYTLMDLGSLEAMLQARCASLTAHVSTASIGPATESGAASQRADQVHPDADQGAEPNSTVTPPSPLNVFLVCLQPPAKEVSDAPTGQTLNDAPAVQVPNGLVNALTWLIDRVQERRASLNARVALQTHQQQMEYARRHAERSASEESPTASSPPGLPAGSSASKVRFGEARSTLPEKPASRPGTNRGSSDMRVSPDPVPTAIGASETGSITRLAPPVTPPPAAGTGSIMQSLHVPLRSSNSPPPMAAVQPETPEMAEELAEELAEEETLAQGGSLITLSTVHSHEIHVTRRARRLSDAGAHRMSQNLRSSHDVLSSPGGVSGIAEGV